MKKRLLQDLLILFLTALIFVCGYVSVMEGILSQPKEVMIKEELTVTSASLGLNAGYSVIVSGVLSNSSNADVHVDNLTVVLSGEGAKSEIQKLDFIVPAGSTMSVMLTSVSEKKMESVEKVTLNIGEDFAVLENPNSQNPLMWLIPALLAILFVIAWQHALRVRLLMAKE